MFPSLVTDVGKVVTDPIPWEEPIVDVYDDEASAVQILNEIKSKSMFQKLDLVLDIEVDIDKETSFDHPNRYGLLCVGLCYERKHAIVIGENACASDAVRDAMYDCFQSVNLVTQNGKFDLAGLQPVLGSLEQNFDTMLAHYCLDERPGIHGLKQMSVEELGAPQYDEGLKEYIARPSEELRHYAGYGRIPRPVLYKYNGYDVCCTFDLKHVYAKRLENKKPDWWGYHYEFKNLRYLHDFLVEASNELMFPELNGMTIDIKYNDQLWHDYQVSIASIREEINAILVQDGWVAINPNSPQQVKKVLVEHFRCRVNSTDVDTLTLLKEGCESRYADYETRPLYLFVTTLLKHRREAKMFGTYVKGIRKRLYRGRIYPTFLLHGTTTGRLASRNPNVQNIPRESKIKQQIIPASEENVFVQADYAQAELRILAWLANEPFFRDILNDPSRDLFDELTPVLYPGLPPKDIVKRQPGGDELWKDIRVRVKAFVYGLGYGRTEFSIAQEYRMPEQEARAVKNRFFETIPNVVDWQKWVHDEVRRGHDLITPFGRHRRFPLITEENWKGIKNEALAFLPQSTSSDVCLRAMVRVRRDLRGSGAFIRNIVHDSILVDCPRDMADDVAKLLDRHMVASGQELVGDYIQFKTDVKVGKHWGEV